MNNFIQPKRSENGFLSKAEVKRDTYYWSLTVVNGGRGYVMLQMIRSANMRKGCEAKLTVYCNNDRYLSYCALQNIFVSHNDEKATQHDSE